MKKNEFLKEATKEQMDRILMAKSADELMALAKEYDVALSEVEAAEAMKKIDAKSFGEISDDDLEAIAGGSTYKDGYMVVTVGYSCEYYMNRPGVGGIQGTCFNCDFHRNFHEGVEICANTHNMQK